LIADVQQKRNQSAPDVRSRYDKSLQNSVCPQEQKHGVRDMKAITQPKQAQLGRPSEVGRAWCDHCGRHVQFVRLDRLNDLLDDGTEESNDLPVTVQSVHFAKDSEGEFAICLKSLFGED
jgi:hypothetical protein